MVAPVKSPLIPLGPCRQRHGHDCGPAAARSVLAYHGRPAVGVDRILKPCRTNGTPPARLVWLFNSCRLGTASRDRMTLDHLRELTDQGVPVLCPVQHRGEGHWVVVRGFAGLSVALMDPAAPDGLTEEPGSEFFRRWRDEADGVRLDRYGIAVFRYPDPR